MNTFAKAIWTIVLAGLALCAPANPQENDHGYRGTIPIDRDGPGLVELAPDVRIYPGQSVEIQASGSANVNQHNYEKRRCKYFGLKCWYEKRSRTRITSHSDFEIVVVLVGASGELDRDIIDSVEPAVLSYPLGGQFGDGAKIHAFIRTWNNQVIDRRNCRNRPRHCSSGSLDLTIVHSKIDQRFDQIAQQLASFDASNVPAQRIRSRDFIDRLTVNSPTRALKMQTELTDRIVEWVKEAADDSQGPIVQVIQDALELSSDPTNRARLNQARLDAYMNLGAYETLANNAHKVINELHEACTEGGRQCSKEQAILMARALRSLATAQAEKRARIELSDLTLSVATLGRGIDVLRNTLDGQAYSGIHSEILILSDLYQDSADVLSLIRTPREIDLAVQHMEQAVCLHRLSLAAQNGDEGGMFSNGATCFANQEDSQ